MSKTSTLTSRVETWPRFCLINSRLSMLPPKPNICVQDPSRDSDKNLRKRERIKNLNEKSGNTKGGSIIVLLTSSLTGLELAV